jgi:hypothetical protein
MRNLLRSEQPGTVLAGVKATPCGWPTASPDPGCGRSRTATGSADREKSRARSTQLNLYGSRGLPLACHPEHRPGVHEERAPLRRDYARGVEHALLWAEFATSGPPTPAHARSRSASP